jgi:predicted GNAT superfamily acetyltransferase
MTEVIIRDVTQDDFGAIITLNDFAVAQTSPMDIQRLQSLGQLSCYHKVAQVRGQVAAFLLAMREGAAYQNDNYSWFASRYRRFIYIDRIVVGMRYSGMKIGSMLYKNLFEFAHLHGISNITCEYNLNPPNPASKSFHDKFGFEELGTQWVANNSKLVSLQAAQI